MVERDRLLLQADPRASQPSAAIATDGALSASSLFFDTRGDRDNLAFGCQFHGHLPKYRVLAAPRADRTVRYFGSGFGRGGGSGSSNLPPITAAALRRLQPPPTDMSDGEATAEVLPLLPVLLAEAQAADGDSGAAGAADACTHLAGDEFERVRELNAATRRAPHDERAWLALAAALDGASGGGGGAAAAVSTVSSANHNRRHASASAERKSEVLRRAVELNPSSEGLRLALLAAHEAYLPHDDVEREWELALASLPGSVALWSTFLGRTGRAFAAFTTSSQRELGARGVGALAAQLAEARSVHAAPERLEALEGAVLLLLGRAALVERAAGYVERGVGLLLALIEYNVLLPPALASAPAATRLAAFEAFWEAEAPRIGDGGGATSDGGGAAAGGAAGGAATARGWRAWYESGGASGRGGGGVEGGDGAAAAEPTRAEAPLQAAIDAELAGLPTSLADDPARLACALWAAREELRASAGQVPLLASHSPDEADDDPERVVLSEDLRPFLVELHTREAHVTLFLLAAALLGVRAALSHLPTSHPLAALVASAAETPEELAAVHAPASHPQADAAAAADDDDDYDDDRAGAAATCWYRPPARALADALAAPAVASRVAAGSGAQQRRLARNLLGAACELYPSERRLASTLLQAAEPTPTAVRRLAKPLLRRAPAELALWLAYAQAEAARGRTAEAFTVYHSALSLCAPPSGDASPLQLLPMAHAAAELCLSGAGGAGGADDAGEGGRRLALCWLISAWVPEAAIAAASSVGGGGSAAAAGAVAGPSAMQLLRARAALEALLAEHLPFDGPSGSAAPSHAHSSQGTPAEAAPPTRSAGSHVALSETAMALACAHALLEYLTSGIEAALQVCARAQLCIRPSSEKEAAAAQLPA